MSESVMAFVQPLKDRLQTLWLDCVTLLPQLAIALIFLIITWLAARGLRRITASGLRRLALRPSLRELLTSLVGVLVWAMGVLIAVTILFPSLTPAKLLAALGIGSLAVGLAFKDIFENFLAGIMIMLRRPMRIGDYILCKDVEGFVETITIRDTYIRQIDEQLVLVPNAEIYKNPVFIRTDKSERQFTLVCGVAYGEDADHARQVIKDAITDTEGVLTNRPVDVFASAFNASSLDFTVRWWAGSRPIDFLETQDRVVRNIKRALDSAAIEIPFPYRTLVFKQDKDGSSETDASNTM